MEEVTSLNGWKKIRDLGEGGFGVVSLWKNFNANKIIALKCCRGVDGMGVSDKVRDNWCQEVEKMSRLCHPNIVKVLNMPEELKLISSQPILCMEYCSRGDLRKELYREENICGLSEEAVRAVLADIMAGISFLHAEKITHRDLKPENIVMQQVHDVTLNTTKVVYKLIDLGFAKVWDPSSLSSTFVGTLQYIAPELFTQDAKKSRSVDYWSLGLICHEVITGFRPFLPNTPLPIWLEKISKKTSRDICIHETADNTFTYQEEIFPENHISQPLKYNLENWLRLALEWDGTKRGRGPDNSLVIFSTLEAALSKKIVTVYCVKRLERLSYEIYDSTLVRTLKQWIERDSDLPVSCQVLLLPTGESLDDNALLHLHVDNDPKLVAMLYVISKEGIRLPCVEILQSKHPALVKRMLEFPSDPLPYHLLRRTWANSVYFIDSILYSYRAFIEAYSVKMLSLIHCQRERLLSLQQNISSALQRVRANLEFSQNSLQFDLDRLRKSTVNTETITGRRRADEEDSWKCDYTPLEADVTSLASAAERLFLYIPPADNRVLLLKNFDSEPGEQHSQQLEQLLLESRRVYQGLTRVTLEKRDQPFNPTSMVQIIFQVWEVIAKIAQDERFSKHLQQLKETEDEVKGLTDKLQAIEQHVSKIQVRLTVLHNNRQAEIWTIVEKLSDLTREVGYSRLNMNEPPDLPTRNNVTLQNETTNIRMNAKRIPLDNWCIRNN